MPRNFVQAKILPKSSRLVPCTKSNSVEEGIKGQVRDPLWFLSRQWQLGEFRARNGGQLVSLEFKSKTHGIEMIKSLNDEDFRPLDNPDINPIEPSVEEEQSGDLITPKAWDSNQLEYHFNIKCGETILEAQGYSGGRLDWYDFNLTSEVNFDGKSEDISVVPTHVEFLGMPNSRWWKFEDGNIDLGDIKRPHLNFLSMLLTEFSLVFSNDWFVVPIKQEVASLRVIDTQEGLKVTDTFGIKSDKITPIETGGTGGNLWSLFSLSSLKNNLPAGSDLFFLPDTVVNDLKSDSLEEISLARDELANIVWAVEHKIFTNGEVVDKDDELARNGEGKKQLQAPQTEEFPLYRLKSYIPGNWIPYIPVQKKDKSGKSIDGSIVFRRAKTDPGVDKQCTGTILKESTTIHEEEIPATPLLLTRRYKLVTYGPEKWKLVMDNTPWKLEREKTKKIKLWIGRNKKPTVKGTQVNLKYDYLIEK